MCTVQSLQMSVRASVYVLMLFNTLITIKAAKIETEKEFKVHYWYGYPNSIWFINRLNGKSHYCRQMSQILELYELFPESNDISVALALAIVKMNLESVKLYMSRLEAQFKYACDTCKKLWKPYPGKEMKADIPPLIERVDRLRTNITDLMLARVPRTRMLRSIAQMFLLNDESWMENIVDFKLIPDLIFNDEAEVLFLKAVPTYEDYLQVINNWDFSFPNINETTYCLGDLSRHVIFHIRFPQQCVVPPDCVKFVTEGTSFGWALSHRLLLMIFAKFGRNCYYISVEDDRLLVNDMCEWARRNMDWLWYGKFDLTALTLEYMVYCSLYGHRNIFNIVWFADFSRVYYAKDMTLKGMKNQVGCVIRQRQTPATEKAITAKVLKSIQAAYDNKNRSWWNLVEYDTNQVGDCIRYDTAMYLAFLASAFRASFQPAYCPYTTFKPGERPLLDYCFVPKKISFNLINHYVNKNENRHNFFEIFKETKICFAFANKSCGPFSVNKSFYYDVNSENTTMNWPRTKVPTGDKD